MEGFILIGSVLLIHVLAWLTPGPQIALIIRNSLVYSRKTGFWTAVGFAIGNFIHISLAVSGVALIFTASPIAHNVIKYLGVGYLLFIGLKTFLIKPQAQATQSSEHHRDIPHLSALRIGLVTNLLSPKAPLFFISIFGSLLSTKAPNWVVGFLMFAMPLNTLFMGYMWTLFLTHRHIKARYATFQPTINKILGIVFVTFALIVAFSGK